jgi:hypothetical protein
MTWPVNYTMPIDYPLLMIRNVGAQTLYLGGTQVTAAAGLPITPGAAVQVPLYAHTLTGTTISIATDDQLTLPKPKPTLGDHISDARLAIEKLPAGHARTMALHALTEASLWATEAKK